MTDKSLMPFGKYKGMAMANVPAGYLRFIYSDFTNLRPDLKKYIEDNLDVLDAEIKRSNKLNSR